MGICKTMMQRKFIRSLLTPIRALNKAKNLYMKNMESCVGRFGDGCGFVAGSSAPVFLSTRSFSTSAKSFSAGVEEVRPLLRTVSSKNDMHRKPMGMRSYSVGLGKIGRIDEDKPCEFEEDEVVLPFYSRSRTYAINRTSFYR